MKKPKLGTGERFSHLEGELEEKHARSPRKLAAWIGIHKYGAKKMSGMAQASKKKKHHEDNR